MSRVYNENITIDMTKAQQFFENRFSKEKPAATMMLRTNSEGIAERRDENEAKLIKSLIDFNEERRILDIGCGYGRLAMHFKEVVALYDGIDSSKTYINAAKELFADYDNINFYTMFADNLDKNSLQKSYNTIFLTALSIYLNDSVLIDVLKSIENIVEANSLFYFRESVSVIGQRLTLKDFHSEELQSEYSAIYRTTKEYEELFSLYLPKAQIISTNLILDESTGARKETNQQYWLLKF